MVNGGYATAPLTHCSIYFFSETTPQEYGFVEDIPEEPSTDDEVSTDNEETTDKAPQTGDTSPIILFSMMMIFASAMILFIVKNKMKIFNF